MTQYLNVCYKTGNFTFITCKFLVKSAHLQCVFHSIRFKVNKGWDQA